MSNLKNLKVIHVGSYFKSGLGNVFLILRRHPDGRLVWYEEVSNEDEKETDIWALNSDEAMRLAHQTWKEDFFRSIICGFRYTLPERDEHGLNALFHQMVASYSSINGQYFDEDAGHLCIVHYASQEARNIWARLKAHERI